MTCQTRCLGFIGPAGVLMALLVSEVPGTLAGAAEPTIPSGESEAHQSLPPEKKRSLAQGMATDQPGEVESRGIPQLQRPMMPGNSAQPSAPGQPTAQAPTWPQKFDVQGPESDSFGFAVTQPGVVIVDVQAQGAPVILTLQGPVPQPISQQGAGQVRLTYTVTPQDVQKGVLWGVQIRLAHPASPQLGGRASGAVMVQHPPVNQAVVQQAVQAIATQQKQPSPQEQQQASAQAAAQTEQAFQQRKAQFDRQQLDRRGALHAQIQPQLDQLRNRMGGQIRPRGLEEREDTPAEAGVSQEGEIGTRALRGDQLMGITKQPLDTTTGQKLGAIVPPATASSAQPIQGVGSTPGPQSVLPNPAIASLSVTQGQPGDPVLINGSGFSNGGGEVHVIVNPGKDLVAPVQVWTDTQIFVTVPDIAGVLTYGGIIYVVRGSDQVKSNLVPWRFNPALELREVRWTTDRRLKFPVDQESPYRPTTIAHGNGNPFWGFKDDDEFFMTTRLKNAWLVDDVGVTCAVAWGNGMCDGNAYAIDSRRGTDSPYIKVHWWLPAAFGGYKYTFYTYVVRIMGPKGIPDGVVMP
ncbi:MAG: IPT/TIG domain-containing protein [Nitrospiraceae bacterium]